VSRKTIWFLIGLAIVIFSIVSFIIFRSKNNNINNINKELAQIATGTPEWLNPDKPMESSSLEENKIPKSAIKIGVSAAGFSAAVFEVKTGQTVILSVTSKDQWTHVFKFRDTSLSNIAVGVAPGETRMITFIAPKKIGDYEFFCDVPGHTNRGEVGKMIVK
jgi:uncharacterized cupredoxin-like copper-binding protein